MKHSRGSAASLTHRNGLKAADKRAKGNGAATNNDILEPFTLHVLWHTYCSMLQWIGADIKTAQYLNQFETYEELVFAVEQFIYYYNYQRRQHKLNCLPPATYRSLLEAA